MVTAPEAHAQTPDEYNLIIDIYNPVTPVTETAYVIVEETSPEP